MRTSVGGAAHKLLLFDRPVISLSIRSVQRRAGINSRLLAPASSLGIRLRDAGLWLTSLCRNPSRSAAVTS